MNVAGASTSADWSAIRSAGAGTPVAAKSTSNVVSGGAENEFLKYAKMSPLERMRANILKGMNRTEDQLASLPQAERNKIEDQIKEQIKKMMAGSDRKGQLVNLSA